MSDEKPVVPPADPNAKVTAKPAPSAPPSQPKKKEFVKFDVPQNMNMIEAEYAGGDILKGQPGDQIKVAIRGIAFDKKKAKQ